MPSASQLESRPASHQHATPRTVIYKLIFSAALIVSAATFFAPLANSQDLGEIARQERAKKQNNPAPPASHIYTNEDVKREEILTPEDKTRFSATTRPPVTTPAQSAPQSASESTSPGNADLPIGARPPLQTASTEPAKTSPPAKPTIRQSAPQQTKQPAQPNISPASTMHVNPNSTPANRATNSVSAKRAQPAGSPGNADRLIGARPPTHTVSSVPELAANQPAVIANAEPPMPQSPTTVPLDQMPLGDVARYYRARKQQAADAGAKAAATPAAAASTVAPLATAVSEPTYSTPQPIDTADVSPAQLSQMPLGDVARYYRAKKREEDAAIATAAPSTPESNPATSLTAAPSQTPTSQSAISRPSKVSSSRYPLAIAAMPLAAMKSAPARPSRPRPSSISSTAHHSIARRSIATSSIASHPLAHPATPRGLVAPKRSVGGIAASVRVSSGDTLWQLARKYLGTGTRWHELAALNPTIQNPRRLQIGVELALHSPNV
jgi:LysM domain